MNAPAQEVKLEGSERVGLCDRVSGRRVASTSSEAPTVATLREFLRAHRTHDVLRPPTIASVAPTAAAPSALSQSQSQTVSSTQSVCANPLSSVARYPLAAAAIGTVAQSVVCTVGTTTTTSSQLATVEATDAASVTHNTQPQAPPAVAAAGGSAGEHSDAAALPVVGHIPPIRIQVRRVLTQILQDRCALSIRILYTCIPVFCMLHPIALWAAIN